MLSNSLQIDAVTLAMILIPESLEKAIFTEKVMTRE
jgi:hypothetical protein